MIEGDIMATALEQADVPSKMMRVAVEGCGHGTLDAIYASIQKSCEVKNWDSVDLVIIGGDFQAVRDRYDLNVTAMPAKYRAMADFHQYYWGTKKAPYLTVFVGGNHEASNHLFELYYGGWVAPNIYYLGAANVLQVGPIKIAGMSGIWKGYDYRKPHYERLPYSQDDMYSIYHVRELDVRKLLSFRSQTDIGISHDWPKGVEWLGNHQHLFKHKPHLREDAQSGKLGNTAAEKVMNRLRPLYWFSAHLHTKYTALKVFDESDGLGADSKKSEPRDTVKDGRQGSQPQLPQVREQVSAWNNFGLRARLQEAQETANALQQEMKRREESERTGIPLTASYTFNETYKQVKLGNGLARDVTSVHSSTEQEMSHSDKRSISQLDGCCSSLPLKRRKELGSSPSHDDHQETRSTAVYNEQTDEPLLSSLTNAVATNPDAIDIEMSDDDDDDDEDEMALLSAGATTAQELNRSNVVQTNSVHDLRHEMKKKKPAEDHAIPAQGHESPTPRGQDLGVNEHDQPTPALNEVSEEMRAQLAALSSKFEEPIEVSPRLPQPEGIKNKSTKFLALSKCEDRQNFLQLLEIEPYEQSTQMIDRPVKLQYVPEWLAILRVFAPELSLGGNPKDQVAQHRGDTYYRERILEEEKWIREHVVEPGLLDVPMAFTTTVPASDPSTQIDSREMPREVTNPQTSEFCKLIQIDNAFDITEEERDARMTAGPAETSDGRRGTRNGRGGRGGRGGGPGYRGGSFRGGRGRSNRGWGGRGRARN